MNKKIIENDNNDIPICNILGINVAAVNMNFVLNYFENNIYKINGNYVCVSNVHTTVSAYEDLEYKNIQNNSLMILPDGKPLSIIGKKEDIKIWVELRVRILWKKYFLYLKIKVGLIIFMEIRKKI